MEDTEAVAEDSATINREDSRSEAAECDVPKEDESTVLVIRVTCEDSESRSSNETSSSGSESVQWLSTPATTPVIIIERTLLIACFEILPVRRDLNYYPIASHCLFCWNDRYSGILPHSRLPLRVRVAVPLSPPSRIRRCTFSLLSNDDL